MAKKDRRGSIEEEVAEEMRQQERGTRTYCTVLVDSFHDSQRFSLCAAGGSLSQMMGLRRAKTAGPRLVNMRRIEELALPRFVTFQPKTQVQCV